MSRPEQDSPATPPHAAGPEGAARAAETRSRDVASRFSAAAARYDQAAAPQAQVARELAASLPPALSRTAPTGATVLEIGCGTGLLTAAAVPLLQPACWLASDIAPAMVATTCRRMAGFPAVQPLLMDGEAPALATGSLDLICSSLAVQWFRRLPESLEQLHALLRPGGLLAVTTLGEGTFAPWRQACAAEGLASGTPAYPSVETLRRQLPAARISEQLVELPWQQGRDFLRHLRTIGAATPQEGYQPLSATSLRRVVAALDRRLAAGDRLAYHVLTVFWPG